MIDQALKREIIAKVYQDESVEELSKLYDIPAVLIQEWVDSDLSVEDELYITLPELLKNEIGSIPDCDDYLEVLKVKTEKMAIALIELMTSNEFSTAVEAKIIQIHTDSLTKIRNSFFKTPTIGIVSTPSTTDGLSMFRKNLKD